MQQERVDNLYATGRSKKGLKKDAAATLMWMYTSREVYHKLVVESAWTPDQYQAWLERTLIETLTDRVG